MAAVGTPALADAAPAMSQPASCRARLATACRDRRQADVKIDGQRVQLGRWGSSEAQEAYDRLIAEWLANGRRLPQPTDHPDNEPVTVTELCVGCMKWMEERHRPNEISNFRSMVRILRSLYGSKPLASSSGAPRMRLSEARRSSASSVS